MEIKKYKKNYYLFKIVVHPKHRGKGYSKKLFNKIIKEVKKRNYKYFKGHYNEHSIKLLNNYKSIENKYTNLDNPLMIGLNNDIISNIKGYDINIYKNFYVRYKGIFSKYMINNFDSIKMYLSEYIDDFYNVLNRINFDYNFYRMFDKKCVEMNDIEIEHYSKESKNITNCAEYCEKNNIEFITLSGHKPTNYLRSLSVVNDKLYFWVDSTDYGIVELTHESILHSII